MRILHVVYGFGYGGIRAFIMNSLGHIDRSKFQFDIYAFGVCESPFTEMVKEFGANIYYEPENNVHKIKRFVNQIETFINEHGPYDVVHAHCNLISAWVLLAAKRAGVSIRLAHSHTASHFSGGLQQKVYSYLRRFIIDQLATEKLACGQLAGENMYGKHVRFTIVNNGIDVARYLHPQPHKIAELRNQLNIHDGVRVYANVTRMTPEKNHLFAIEVFKEIHKIEPNSIFIYGGVITSAQSTEEEVNAKIEEYGLKDFVRFTGPFMEVEHLYHLSDVWIYCSTYEGLPFGTIELQAASVPCLASDVITHEIDLGLGLVEFLSLSDNPKVWAEKAISMQKTKISTEKIKTAFKEHFFDIKESVKRLEDVYLQTV